MAGQLEPDADFRLIHIEARGLGDIGRRTRDSREYTVNEARWLAVWATIGLHLSGDAIANAKRSPALHNGETDPRAPRGDFFSHQSCQVGHRAAEFATEQPKQRPLLLGRGAIIDVADRASPSLEDIAWNIDRDAKIESRDIDAVDFASLDAIGQGAPASAMVRVLSDPAWAKRLAIADLKKIALETVRHGSFPCGS